jgi:excisionase family DNA binding protein
MNLNRTFKSLQNQILADPMLTPTEAGQLMGISISTLYRLRRSGSGPAWLRLGGKVRYRTSAIQAYLDAAEAASL